MAVASISILGVLGMTIERFVYFESHFRNVSVNVSEGSGQYFLEANDCDKWVCTNDFIFTVVVILNLGKKRRGGRERGREGEREGEEGVIGGREGEEGDEGWEGTRKDKRKERRMVF